MLPIEEQLLFQTNIIRSAHSLPPLTWNTDLANEVQKYANTCPGPKHGGPKGHQNLAPFTHCSVYGKCENTLGAAWTWYNKEETLWNYDVNACSTGQWYDCGHFSNMMDPSVTEMGCGFSLSSWCGGSDYVWCNYVGNVNNPVIPYRLVSKDELEQYLLAN